MTSTKKTLRSTFAALSVATLTMVAMPGVSFAVEPDGDGAAAAPQAASVATQPATATLRVHKTTENPGERGDGTVNETLENSAQKVKGITFKVYKLTKSDGKDFDLSTNEGWQEANKGAKKFNDLNATERNKAIQDGSFGDFKIVPVAGDNAAKETDSTGTATFADLPRGMYVVAEQTPTDWTGVSVGGEPLKAGQTLQGAMPFVVALPMTDQKTKDGWLQTVNVYPKNSKTNIEKSVKDVNAPGAGNGTTDSQVEYTVKTTAPNTKATKVNDYQIVDRMPARVKYIGQGAKVTLNDTDLDAADYTIASYYGGRMLVADLTDTGLAKVNAQSAGDTPATVSLTFKASVGQLPVGTTPASLINHGYLIPPNSGNAHWTPNKPGTKKECLKLDDNGGKVYGDIGENGENLPNADGDSTQGGINVPKGDNPNYNVAGSAKTDSAAGLNNSTVGTTNPPATDSETDDCLPVPPGPGAHVISKFGKVKINKVDKDNPSTTLAGAVFQLYTCDQDGNKTNWKTDFSKAADADPVSVNGFNTWTTLKPGATADTKEAANNPDNYQPIVISGLELNDFANQTSAKPEKATHKDWRQTRFYCLFEVKAPAGYELLPKPIKFQLLTNGSDATAPIQTIGVEDVPANGGFNLPLTGGKGVLPLIALGGLLVIGAGGYAAVAAKRNRKEA